MSVKKSFRWTAQTYHRDTRTHFAEVDWVSGGANAQSRDAVWSWMVWRVGESEALASGRVLGEKAAKLAARRAMDRDTKASR